MINKACFIYSSLVLFFLATSASIAHFSGKLYLKTTPENSTIWIVIASTPDHFTSNQTYSYKLKIDLEK